MAALAIELVPNIMKIGKTDVSRFANLG